jgi:hypothetical protein
MVGGVITMNSKGSLYETAKQIWQDEFLPLLVSWGFELTLQPAEGDNYEPIAGAPQTKIVSKLWEIKWGNRKSAYLEVYTYLPVRCATDDRVFINASSVINTFVFLNDHTNKAAAESLIRNAYRNFVARLVVAAITNKSVRYRPNLLVKVGNEAFRLYFHLLAKNWVWEVKTFLTKQSIARFKQDLAENPIEFFHQLRKGIALQAL